MAFPDTITLDTADVDGGTARELKTIEWLSTQLTTLLGTLNATKATDGDTASASALALLRGIAYNTGNGVVLTTNLLRGVTAAMTGTTSTTALAAAGSGVKNVVTGVILANSHATVGTYVNVLDGATVIATFYVPALSTVGATGLNIPGTANTAINVQNVTTGANVIATVVGYKE